MSTIHEKDRASLCSFTFADGRRCRTPRQSGHAQYCCFHARKQAQLQAAEGLGRDFAFLLSGDYFSACDLATALGRLFAAVARGHVKPKAAATVAYLAQTLLLTIQAAENEYINAFGTDSWRNTVYSHIKQNQKYLAQNPAQPVPQPAPQLSAHAPQPISVSAQPGLPVEAGPQPDSSLPAPVTKALAKLAADLQSPRCKKSQPPATPQTPATACAPEPKPSRPHPNGCASVPSS